ncbi:hypothetical protein JCM19046_4238 [Bacillus sp. JCM 19046]|nr:hypothetical protein JCM19045_120 [Bacillus sp. JCM 19045]GAF19578.1 hypothetical protein JCM19046_4238 [Bacillus sp. JCM 19046]
MKKLLISGLVLLVILVSFYFFFRETFDRFNPFIEQEYVYVEIQDEPVDDDGRYKYDVSGINESGETKRVVFSTSTRLNQGTLLRVLAKGTHTEEYSFIEDNEMP